MIRVEYACCLPLGVFLVLTALYGLLNPRCHRVEINRIDKTEERE